MEVRKRFVRFSEIVVVVAMTIIFLISMLAAVGMGLDNMCQMAGTVIVFFALIVIAQKSNINYESRHTLLCLLLICIFTKGIVVLLIQPTPGADALAMFEYTNEILTNGKMTVSARFIAGFPHIMGYVLFISAFFKVFGHVPIVAACVNVCLSIVSMLVIYRIGDKIMNNKKMAFWSSLLWCLCPSQALWNCFVLSETYYTTLLVVVIYLIMRALKEKNVKAKKMGLYGLCIGIVLGLFNMTRPVGIVLIIAMVLIILCLEIRIKKQMIILLISTIISFALMQGMINVYEKNMLGEEPAGFPWYNIAVGCNEDYGGLWNQEDWNSFMGLLNSEESAVAAQKKMQPIVMEHVKNVDNWPNFLMKKMENFVGDDSSSLIGFFRAGGITFGEKQQILVLVCNVFFYAVELMMMGSVFLVAKRKQGRELYLSILFYIGSFLAYMIVEVQTRYHYPLTAIAIVLSGYFLAIVGKEKIVQ